MTLIQRFGSALNLNIHLHMLFLDGVYVTAEDTFFFPAGHAADDLGVRGSGAEDQPAHSRDL